MSGSPLQGPRSLPGMGSGPGLCGACAHLRVVTSGRGSRFFLCERSRSNPRFPRYPPIPVVRCDGWEPAGEEPGVPEDPSGG